MKTKEHYIEEYINYLYGDIEEEDRPLYQPEITQSRADFKTGFNLAEELFKPKWISVDEQTPEDGRAVLVKTKDYRRPQYDVTDVQIGYLENEVWYYNEGGEINSGLGWHLTHWMEIPK